MAQQPQGIRNDLASARHPAARPARRPLNVRQLAVVLVGAAVLWMVAWWAYERFIKSDVDKIRELVAGSAQGARDRHPNRVTRILSKDFRGPAGIDKDMVHRAMASILMNQYRKVEVDVQPVPLDVQMDPNNPDRATAVFTVHVRGKITEDSDWVDLDSRAGGPKYHATFKRTEHGWQMSELDITLE